MILEHIETGNKIFYENESKIPSNFIIEKIVTNMTTAVDWIASNLNIFAILIMVAGISVWGLGIIATTKMIEKRDFI